MDLEFGPESVGHNDDFGDGGKIDPVPEYVEALFARDAVLNFLEAQVRMSRNETVRVAPLN